MDTAKLSSGQVNTRYQRYSTSAWYLLRDLRLTGSLVVLIGLVLLLMLFLPQSAGPFVTAETWTLLLPAWLQPWGSLLYLVGGDRLGRSLWLWGPVAGLMLSCAVALVDYGWPARRRAREFPADLAWQPPLTRRVEKSTRLPADPDTLLVSLKDKLVQLGFALDASDEDNGRTVSAYRRRWAWWAVPGLYAGLLLLCLGLLTSRYTLATENLSLSPSETRSSRLFDGNFALTGANQLTFTAANGTAQTLPVRLYQPAFLNGAWLFPISQAPVLTVEAQDRLGRLRRLLPTRPDLAPTERLNLPLDQPGEPLYFSIPSEKFIVQILPEAGLSQRTVNLQIVRRAETEPAFNQMVEVGRSLSFEGLTLSLASNYMLEILVWRDGALPFYGLGLLATLASTLVLSLAPPWQIWLVPEVKGRGGQLYAMAESFNGSKAKMTELLRQLLAPVELDSPGTKFEKGMTPEAESEIEPD
jgi:hypothetical protein